MSGITPWQRATPSQTSAPTNNTGASNNSVNNNSVNNNSNSVGGHTLTASVPAPQTRTDGASASQPTTHLAQHALTNNTPKITPHKAIGDALNTVLSSRVVDQIVAAFRDMAVLGTLRDQPLSLVEIDKALSEFSEDDLKGLERRMTVISRPFDHEEKLSDGGPDRKAFDLLFQRTKELVKDPLARDNINNNNNIKNSSAASSAFAPATEKSSKQLPTGKPHPAIQQYVSTNHHGGAKAELNSSKGDFEDLGVIEIQILIGRAFEPQNESSAPRLELERFFDSRGLGSFSKLASAAATFVADSKQENLLALLAAAKGAYALQKALPAAIESSSTNNNNNSPQRGAPTSAVATTVGKAIQSVVEALTSFSLPPEDKVKIVKEGMDKLSEAMATFPELGVLVRDLGKKHRL
jgi:hypothetical protein